MNCQELEIAPVLGGDANLRQLGDFYLTYRPNLMANAYSGLEGQGFMGINRPSESCVTVNNFENISGRPSI